MNVRKKFYVEYPLAKTINEAIKWIQKGGSVWQEISDEFPECLGFDDIDCLKENFPETKSDLSMVMYQKVIDDYIKPNGYISFITTNSWMFLKSFEEFRKRVLNSIEFSTLVDFGTELFDGKVGHNPIVAWVNRNLFPRSDMMAIRLVDFNYSKRDQKESEYLKLSSFPV